MTPARNCVAVGGGMANVVLGQAIVAAGQGCMAALDAQWWLEMLFYKIKIVFLIVNALNPFLLLTFLSLSITL